ncbi:MAG: hypothetical protein KAQ65_06700, partial [Candidatus Thorarchaeota archaeon]|nr:hypothetical protein [Candidatus Thorarchaeota archaeon]
IRPSIILDEFLYDCLVDWVQGFFPSICMIGLRSGMGYIESVGLINQSFSSPILREAKIARYWSKYNR